MKGNPSMKFVGDYKILDPLKDRKLVEYLKSRYKVVDQYNSQVEELWKIRNPKAAFSQNFGGKDSLGGVLSKFHSEILGNSQGKWIWYPWKETLVHILDNDYFQELRTARNKFLINEEEQKLFQDYKVGIIGLSVGNNVATTLRVQGGVKAIKLADYDVLSLSNMNRMRVGVSELGLKKTEIAKRQILEIDPYTKITLFGKGIDEENINQFLDNLDLVIDEVDDLKIKMIIRIEARKRKIPVLMLTDNDDGVLVDYYPYHKSKKVPLFYGIKDDLVINNFNKESINKREIAKLSSQIVGCENISKRMKTSLKSVGKDLYSWPQLATAAFFSGVVGCYFVRMLAIGKEFKIKHSLIRINDLIPCN